MECLDYDGLAYFKGKLDSEISATLIVDSTSGTIASFPDGADGIPVKDLTVGIEPVQDLHGYDAPWPAGGGKNKANITAETIQKPSWYPGGWNGTSVNNKHGITQTRGYQQGGAGGFHLTNISAGTYTFSMTFSGTTSSCMLYVSSVDGGGNVTTIVANVGMTKDGTRYKYTFTVPDGAEDVVFRPTIWSATESYDLEDIQIESGSSDTEWTPYSNICPISGWTGCNIYRTGKNLLNCQIEGKEQNGIISSNNLNGSIHLQGTTTGARFYTYLKNNFNLKPGTYRFSKNLSLTSGSISVQLQGFNSSNQIVSRYTVGNSSTNASVSITEPAAYYNVFIDITGMTTSTAVNLDLEIQLELGSTASAWKQFYGTTIPVSWQSEAGTVYGGTLTVNEDGSADLTVDYASVTFDGSSDEGWSAYSTHGFSPSGSGMKSGTRQAGFCDTFKILSPSDGSISSAFGIALGLANSGMYFVGMITNIAEVTDLATWKTWLASHNVTVVYPLATTATYHLTGIDQIPTLLGTNNIWAGCGDIDKLEYVADTKLYIDNKIATAIANVLNA